MGGGPMAELRPPRVEEATAIAALMSRFAPEPISEERVRRSWSAPSVDRERDARVSVRSGSVVGCVALHHDTEQQAWLELHGVELDELLDWALETASGRRLFSGGWHQNARVRMALEERDFALVRHSYRMAIDLGGSAPPPDWPARIDVRTFRPDDAHAVYEAHMETFEDSWEHVREPYEEWAHWTLERPGFDPELWLLATSGEDVAGIALCRVHDADPETGLVAILGVRRPWRRQGLGRALLLESFRRLAAAGCMRAILGVDASSLTGANKLYENAGMRVVSTFDIYERRL